MARIRQTNRVLFRLNLLPGSDQILCTVPERLSRFFPTASPTPRLLPRPMPPLRLSRAAPPGCTRAPFPQRIRRSPPLSSPPDPSSTLSSRSIERGDTADHIDVHTYTFCSLCRPPARKALRPRPFGGRSVTPIPSAHCHTWEVPPARSRSEVSPHRPLWISPVPPSRRSLSRPFPSPAPIARRLPLPPIATTLEFAFRPSLRPPITLPILHPCQTKIPMDTSIPYRTPTLSCVGRPLPGASHVIQLPHHLLAQSVRARAVSPLRTSNPTEPQT